VWLRDAPQDASGVLRGTRRIRKSQAAATPGCRVDLEAAGLRQCEARTPVSLPYSSLERDFCRQRQTRQKGLKTMSPRRDRKSETATREAPSAPIAQTTARPSSARQLVVGQAIELWDGALSRNPSRDVPRAVANVVFQSKCIIALSNRRSERLEPRGPPFCLPLGIYERHRHGAPHQHDDPAHEEAGVEPFERCRGALDDTAKRASSTEQTALDLETARSGSSKSISNYRL